jgi:branched-chain amino acid transport system substrate-binding protein
MDVARAADGVIKIGVLNDETGIYADFGGPGSVAAARMAVEDAGGSVLGKPIEVVVGDHQNKADVGAAIARRWFEVDKVDMIVDLSNSAVALAVENVAKERNRIVIAGAVGTTDFTGKNCMPTEASWLHDSYALATSVARAEVAKGLDTWFFITVDYSFGHSLEADARRAIEAAGGKVVGSVRHPLNATDFSSYLVQAQASGAKVVALANAGGDMTAALKQAKEFDLVAGGQTLVSFLVFISDLHSLGLKAAQGLTFATAFDWNRDEASRQWARRFYSERGSMPTANHASVYSATRHYLEAVAAVGTDAAPAVMEKMRELPVDDFFASGARLRIDGRLVHDLYLAQAKKPEESTGPWDYVKILGTIPGDQAFRSLADGGCPLGQK